MANMWFTSDTHYNHENILKFVDDKGDFIRPGFKNVDHMNEVLIDNFNKYVKPQDHVYFCGDVFFGSKDKIPYIMKRLNGKKRLVLGNHDDIQKQKLHEHFEKIMLWRHFKTENFLVTHIPLMADQFRHAAVNVHGHLHANFVMNGNKKDDRYINVCVENTEYRPFHMDDIMKIMRQRGF